MDIWNTAPGTSNVPNCDGANLGLQSIFLPKVFFFCLFLRFAGMNGHNHKLACRVPECCQCFPRPGDWGPRVWMALPCPEILRGSSFSGVEEQAKGSHHTLRHTLFQENTLLSLNLSLILSPKSNLEPSTPHEPSTSPNPSLLFCFAECDCKKTKLVHPARSSGKVPRAETTSKQELKTYCGWTKCTSHHLRHPGV